ncbi:hypothetical protein K7X08_017510 [Anisodus acutangulus]|uniref:Uncharacterized protein n=1 Tax=Anisodus acutangulus TaxID=402998 RepID=A0A9Q1LXI0_9SOLA|nr:hypothetical protein K7X08_017510 [Anisodus acutangulus]
MSNILRSGVDSFCQGPSRSSRKQYARRQRLREMLKLYENAAPESEGLLHWKQQSEEDKGGNTNRQEQVNVKSTLCKKTGQHSDMEDEIVPDQALQQDQVQVEDGLLEVLKLSQIEFTSCVNLYRVLSVLEVRLVKNGTSESAAGLSGQPSEGPATNESNPVLNAGEEKTDGPDIGKRDKGKALQQG